MGFKNKLIIVTGGTSGIGEQIVNDLTIKGATVAVLSRGLSNQSKAYKQKNSDKIHFFGCDIAIEDQVKKSFKLIANKLGKCDGLVNNAGINPSRNNILSTSFKDWRKTLDVNLTGMFNCTKNAISIMNDKGLKSVVNISSIAGIIPLQKRTAYMASKFGMIGLASSLAIDFAKDQIRINTICPGYVNTPLVSNYLKNLKKEERDNLLKSHILGRIGQPKDISPFVLFLLSNKSSWVTGSVIPVDGGYSLGMKKSV